MNGLTFFRKVYRFPRYRKNSLRARSPLSSRTSSGRRGCRFQSLPTRRRYWRTGKELLSRQSEQNSLWLIFDCLSARLVLNAECLKLTSLNFDRMKREASLLEPNELELLELRSRMLY